MATKKAVTKNVPAVVETNALILAERPDFLPAADSTARGSENVSTSDLIIPRLEIVQGMSPIKDEVDCNDGDLYNSVTNEIYGPQVNVIPIYYRKEFLVWKVREKGQPAPTDSFKGSYPTAEAALAAIEQLEDPEKYEYIDTPQQFCLLLKDDGTTEEIVVSMSRTKNKVSRKWNSLIRLAGGDRFSKVYTVHGVKEKNAYGTFFNYDVAPTGWPTKVLYDRAEKLYLAITSGKVKVAADTAGQEGGEAPDNTEY